MDEAKRTVHSLTGLVRIIDIALTGDNPIRDIEIIRDLLNNSIEAGYEIKKPQTIDTSMHQMD